MQIKKEQGRLLSARGAALFNTPPRRGSAAGKGVLDVDVILSKRDKRQA